MCRSDSLPTKEMNGSNKKEITTTINDPDNNANANENHNDETKIMSSSSTSRDDGNKLSTTNKNTTTTRRRKRTKQVQNEQNRAKILQEQQRLRQKQKQFHQPRKKQKSKALLKHEQKNDTNEGSSSSGGIEALLPSLLILVLIAFGIAAKMGFRGRATVCGIDLGTTNSVVCVQQQSDGKGVGKIECIPDPYTNSPIVPSVISFLDPHDPSILSTQPLPKKEIKQQYKSTTTTSSYTPPPPENPSSPILLDPHPSRVIVGSAAKLRINTHPHHTLYNAKRVLGVQSCQDGPVEELKHEVDFHIICNDDDDDDNNDDNDNNDDTSNNNNNEEYDNNHIAFQIPFHTKTTTQIPIVPHKVGSYIVHHLLQITQQYLQHNAITSAVIAIPAKFNSYQRYQTVKAFTNAGITVARILEEPVAAALAYGLQKKDGVNYIIVYDFGGGTLDVSALHVSDGGYVEVMGSDGDNQLGGVDFDVAVAHYLLETYPYRFGGMVEEVVVNDNDDDGATITMVEQGAVKEEQNGQVIVDSIGRALGHMEATLLGGDDYDGMDIEEVLASQCDRLDKVPICTLSSFHTIGEKMKIDLAQKGGGGGEEEGINEVVVQGTCLGLPQSANHGNILPKSIPEFCSSLEPKTFTMTTTQYDRACKALYDRSVIPVRRLLSDLNLETEEIDEVVMVGGTTRMPQIREIVKRELEIENLNTHIDPDLTVAYGAASVID